MFQRTTAIKGLDSSSTPGGLPADRGSLRKGKYGQKNFADIFLGKCKVQKVEVGKRE